jgi:hypothetical protein
MYKLLFISTFLVIYVTEIFAQGRVGSPYTRYGIGDIYNTVQSRNKAMGGLAYALPYQNSIDFVNPASGANIDSLTFIFDFGFDGGARLFAVKNPETKMLKSDFNLAHIIVGFPVSKWWKVSSGLIPFSNVGYDIGAIDSVFNVNKTYLFQGFGGINKVFLNNGFNIARNLNIGVNLGYNFGKIYQTSGLKFNANDGGLLNVVEQNSIRISDFCFESGLGYKFKLNDKSTILLGAVYGYNNKLNAYKSTLIYNSLSVGSSVIQDTIYLSEDERGEITLPQKIGFGLGYFFDEKFFIGADFTMQDWTKSPFFNEIDSSKNNNYLSLGFEYKPAGANKNPLVYSSSIIYRGGLYLNSNYFRFSGNEYKINDFGISFGLGLPVKRSKTVFNLSLQIGQRGNLDNSLIRENYFVFGLSFNLGETWFVKSRFD